MLLFDRLYNNMIDWGFSRYRHTIHDTLGFTGSNMMIYVLDMEHICLVFRCSVAFYLCQEFDEDNHWEGFQNIGMLIVVCIGYFDHS